MQLEERSSNVGSALKWLSRAFGQGMDAELEPPIPVAIPIDIVPLSKAVICVDCEAITTTKNVCPVCSSPSLINLARILNRKPM